MNPAIDVDPIDIASGSLVGLVREQPVLSISRQHPQEALRAAIRPCLLRQPCVVSFSGGRDSSSLLALAVSEARRMGVADPVPVTLRFGADDTREDDFQQLVIDHLGVTEWTILEPGQRLDLLGAVSLGLGRRHGLLYPPNIHFHIPMLEAARGGSLITGFGGDEVMSSHPWSGVAQMVSGRTPPRRGQLVRSLVRAGPLPLRRRWLTARLLRPLPWLTSDANHEYLRRRADMLATSPVRASKNLTHIEYRTRSLLRTLSDFDRIAADYGVAMNHPFAAPMVGAALAGSAGVAGMGGRESAMALVFGDLIPEAVLRRTDKASFNSVFWTDNARRVASTLPIDGTDPGVVNRDALSSQWCLHDPDARTHLLAKHLHLVATGADAVTPELSAGPRPTV